MKKTNYKGVYYSVKDNNILVVDSINGKWEIQKMEDGVDLSLKKIFDGDFLDESGDIEKPSIDKFNLLIVDTTDTCNLLCKYCSMNATNKGTFLEKSTFFEAFNKFLSLPNVSEYLTVEFSGGEPLMNFNLIKSIVPEIIKISNSKSIKVLFSIQTNATLLNNDIADFLFKYNFSVGISIDGPKKWNKNRVFSDNKEAYESILDGIKLLRNKCIPFSVLGVISDSCQYNDYLEFVYNNEITNFRLNTLANIGRNQECNNMEKYYENYVKEYIKMAKKLILEYKYKNFYEANLTNFLWSLLEWQPHMCFRNPCGAGKNQLHLSAYGEFYPCQDWRSVNDAKICDVNKMNNSLEEYIRNHNRCTNLNKTNYENYSDMCYDCEWIAYCGTCPREIYTNKTDSDKIGLCKFNNSIYENLCWIIYEHKTEVLRYLGVD